MCCVKAKVSRQFLEWFRWFWLGDDRLFEVGWEEVLALLEGNYDLVYIVVDPWPLYCELGSLFGAH